MHQPIINSQDFSRKAWKDLDEHEVRFCNGKRPGSQYLYSRFLFCIYSRLGPVSPREKGEALKERVPSESMSLEIMLH